MIPRPSNFSSATGSKEPPGCPSFRPWTARAGRRGRRRCRHHHRDAGRALASRRPTRLSPWSPGARSGSSPRPAGWRPGRRCPGAGAPAFTTLPVGSAPDIAAAVRFASVLAGRPAAASLAFLQSFTVALRAQERRVTERREHVRRAIVRPPWGHLPSSGDERRDGGPRRHTRAVRHLLRCCRPLPGRPRQVGHRFPGPGGGDDVGAVAARELPIDRSGRLDVGRGPGTGLWLGHRRPHPGADHGQRGPTPRTGDG